MKTLFIFFILIQFQIKAGDHQEFATIHNPMQTAHQQFSLHLFKASYQKERNTFICPYAIESILKMLCLGSYKITAYELKNVLRLPLKTEELNEFQSTSMVNLQTALDQGDYTQKQALYISHGIKIDPLFFQPIQKTFPFETLYEDSTKTAGIKIAEWLSTKCKKSFYPVTELNQKETKGKISPITFVDFTFQWNYPFDPIMTSIDSFHYSSSPPVQGIVDMMEQLIQTDYFEDESLQAIELPMENHLSCLIVFPKNEGMKKIIDLLEKPIFLKKIVSKMKKTSVIIKMPKIQLDSPIFYKEALLKMGLNLPFLKLADFRLIDPKHAICLDQPIQFCKITFTESGVNADHPIKQKKAIPLHAEATMHINKPFIFFLLDSRNLTLLLAGCYQSPI